MQDRYLIVDIETCPVELDMAMELEDEEERKKLINPIDSRIVAIGVRRDQNDLILLEESEKAMLEKFWEEWKSYKGINPNIAVVGFNITSFDIPFLVTRSLVNDVSIEPFVLKDIVDLRDKISAYRYGKTRGTLKEFAKLMDIELHEADGSDIMRLCSEKKNETIRDYLAKDLEITDELYKRCKRLNITKINKW